MENFQTWKWCSGLPEKRRAHLPPDKQYLVTRDVPCIPPPDSTAGGAAAAEGVEDTMVEDDWVATGESIEGDAGDVGDGTGVEEISSAGDASAQAGDGDGEDDNDDDDDDDVESLENFDYAESAVKDDDAAALASGAAGGGAGEATTISTRTYDVYVT